MTLLLLLNVWLVSGRIKAIQLEYSEARRTLTNALRKAPQHTAVGFKQTVSVHLCLRSLLPSAVAVVNHDCVSVRFISC